MTDPDDPWAVLTNEPDSKEQTREHARHDLGVVIESLIHHCDEKVYDKKTIKLNARKEVMSLVDEVFYSICMEQCGRNQTRVSVMTGENRGTIRQKLTKLGMIVPPANKELKNGNRNFEV